MLALCRFLVFSASFLLLSVAARAQWEVEADPTAYALRGFSVHVGRPILNGRSRLQFGAFGAETPQWMHGNDGFTENSRGVTLKLDYFPKHRSSGLFFGADSNYARVRYELRQTHERTHRNLGGLGPRAGYRFNVGEHFSSLPGFQSIISSMSRSSPFPRRRSTRAGTASSPQYILGGGSRNRPSGIARALLAPELKVTEALKYE